MAHIRDGLTTGMTYAVLSSARDFGEPARQHGEDRLFWGMLKPPFEAYKIVELLARWGATVYPVGDVAGVAGLRCFPTIADVPGPVDCAVVSLPRAEALAQADALAAARVPAVWLQYAVSKDLQGRADQAVRAAFESRGMRVIVGCVLLHWDCAHVSGLDRGRHICHIHASLAHAARIRVNEQGAAERIEPADPRALAWSRETVGTKLIAPLYPDAEILPPGT